MKSDVELLHEIKDNGNLKAEYTLFTKYEPFLYKYYKNLCFKLPSEKYEFPFEDFKQEIYLTVFKKLIKYIDFNKIKNNNWKIVQIFKWMIKTFINKRINKKCNKEVYCTYVEDYISEVNDTPHAVNTYFTTPDSYVSEVLSKIELEDFLKICSDREKKIVLAKLYNRSTLEELTHIFDIKRSRLHQIIGIIKNKYAYFIDNYA